MFKKFFFLFSPGCILCTDDTGSWTSQPVHQQPAFRHGCANRRHFGRAAARADGRRSNVHRSNGRRSNGQRRPDVLVACAREQCHNSVAGFTPRGGERSTHHESRPDARPVQYRPARHSGRAVKHAPTNADGIKTTADPVTYHDYGKCQVRCD